MVEVVQPSSDALATAIAVAAKLVADAAWGTQPRATDWEKEADRRATLVGEMAHTILFLARPQGPTAPAGAPSPGEAAPAAGA